MWEGTCKQEEKFRAAPLPYELKDIKRFGKLYFFMNGKIWASHHQSGQPFSCTLSPIHSS